MRELEECLALYRRWLADHQRRGDPLHDLETIHQEKALGAMTDLHVLMLEHTAECKGCEFCSMLDDFGAILRMFRQMLEDACCHSIFVLQQRVRLLEAQLRYEEADNEPAEAAGAPPPAEPEPEPIVLTNPFYTQRRTPHDAA